MDNEYISIMEFADLAGVSIGDLFGQVIRGELDGLYKEVDRKTYISKTALERFQKPAEEAPQEQPAEPEAEEKPKRPYIEDPIEDYDEGDFDTEDPQEYDGDENRQRWLVQELKETSAMVRHLLGQLRKADEIIEQRDKQIHELSLQLAEMAVKTHAITEQALQTVNQQQILTAMATKKTPWYKRLLSAGKVGKDNAGNI